MFKLRASQGIKECRNAKRGSWKAVNIVSSRDSKPPTVSVDSGSSWYNTSACGMQRFLPWGIVSQIDVADEEQREDVLYSDHAGWELRCNETSSLVGSPMRKHLSETSNRFGSSWPHKNHPLLLDRHKWRWYTVSYTHIKDGNIIQTLS